MASSTGEVTTASALISRMPFSNATGKGIRIAVIDSGVNVSHPHIVAKTLAAGQVFSENNPLSLEDKLGHGTAVTAAIQEKAPGAEYYAVKLFDRSLSTTSSRLMQAIEWAIENRMHLVNLSLGTPNFEYKSAFQSIVKRASVAGVVLICARYETKNPVLPGILPGVVSVDVDWQLTRHSFRVVQEDGQTSFRASGFPRPLPGISPARNLNGISFAVANMTGIVARACEAMDTVSYPNICEALASNSSIISA